MMKACAKYILYWSSMTLMIVILLVSCSPVAPQVGTPTQPIPVTGESQATQAILTAFESGVSLVGANGNEQVVPVNTPLKVQLNDHIKVDESGRAVLQFEDQVEVQIFRDTEIALQEANVESGGSIFVRLKLLHGHTQPTLNALTIARLALDTDDSTITTLEEGSQFTVCFAPGTLTCVEVDAGSVEVVSAGMKSVYRQGEATYYQPGQPPQPPICVQPDSLMDWQVRMRGTGEVEGLGALVQSWPQQPCSGAALQTTLPQEGNPLPTTVATQAPMPPNVPYYVRINGITINQKGHYVVDYETFGYTEQLPGMHVHFFFNTVTPENAGVPGAGPWYLYGGPRPFRGYTVNDRPAGATQMCALVANPDHSVQPDTGNCVDLPSSP
jgi:hypothetical protein